MSKWRTILFYAKKIALAYVQWKAKKPGDVIPFPPDPIREKLTKLQARKQKVIPPKDAA